MKYRLILAAHLLVALLAGCASLPGLEELNHATPPHLQPNAPPGIQDGRDRFRAIFCAALEATDGSEGSANDCGGWFFQNAGPAAALGSSVRIQPGALRVVIVEGAFSECFGAGARPFGDVVDVLRSEGYPIEIMVVSGRSGPAHNAAQIAEFLAENANGPDAPLVLIGYSKGTTDILHFLVSYPSLAERVSAVVSVAGAVRGSPLADDFSGIYDVMFSHLPAGHCSTGDGAVLRSLRTDVRAEWLRAHPLPDHVRYYSLAAFTTRARMANALVPTWELLLRHNRQNDGQLLPEDALIPDSTLLGYLNADHWAVAMRLEDHFPALAHRRDPNPFPQEALLRAILRQVAEDLHSPPSTQAPPGAN